MSNSVKDKPVADTIVFGLENEGIRCWIARRDITSGSGWAKAIYGAIQYSRVIVVILSGNPNCSNQVIREVECAAANNLIIIPFQLEDMDPIGEVTSNLSTEHWLDATKPPIDLYI